MAFPTFATLATLTLLATTVVGHGVPTNFTIANVNYQGYNPFQDQYMPTPPARIMRGIGGNGFVTNVMGLDIQCGGFSDSGPKKKEGTDPAQLEAGPVNAGTDVNIIWTLWPDSHNGSILTYMAKCPDPDCTKWLPGTEPVWFKIKEDGRTASGGWATDILIDKKNFLKGVSYTIPPCLASGSYLVRHEIIAVFAAQVYPSCHQIKVVGTGSSTGPTDSVPTGNGDRKVVKVAFPGAYSPKDPGLTYPLWGDDSKKNLPYVAPGPGVFTCDGAKTAATKRSPSASDESSSTSASPARFRFAR